MLEQLLQDLDEARRRVGLSKTELARLADTQPAAIRRLLTKETQNPTLSTVASVADVIDHEIRVVPKTNVNVFGSKPKGRTAPSGASQVVGNILGTELLEFAKRKRFGTVLADPPWRFINRTGKVAPEHRRLSRYDTMTVREIAMLPVSDVVANKAHLYLWVPNALLADGLHVMQAWGFTYKSNIVWAKRRKDGGPDGRGVGFYFRNVTELLLFGVKGQRRTNAPGRRQVNMIETRKREHSRKPDEQYDLVESCSSGPYLELFARYSRKGWTSWGLEANDDVTPRGKQYAAYR